VGYNTLPDIGQGTSNTGIGSNAFSEIGGGNGLTCVGAFCTARTGLSNATAIGAFSQVTQSNSLVLGCVSGLPNCTSNTSVGIGTTSPSNIFTIAQNAGAAIADGWNTYSSRRWKTNIQTLPDALAKVEQLRGVSYDLKDSGKHEIGVIAEEVGKVVPEIVSWDKNGKDARGVDYSRLTALLIEATKQQQALIHKQQQQIRTQQAKLKAQDTRLDEQQAQISASAKLARTQQAAIAELMSQVNTIQATLKTNGRAGSEVRTVKAQLATVKQ
jgi:hypothetical protein